MTEPVTPPAAPQEAAGEGAPLPPIFQPLGPGIQSAVELLRLPDVVPSPEAVADFLLAPKPACTAIDGEPSGGDVADAQPTAPGPTVANLQAELAAERARADLCDAEAVSQRQRADAAEAQLRAIAEALDPEDSPTHDADDQPIPLPRRVEVALMPDPIGKSDLERRITKALDRYDAPKGFGSFGQASPYGRVLLTARENNQLKADKAALQSIIDNAEWIVHHCGSYGATASLADRVLRLLPVDRQRAILELKRSEANIEVLRINARFLNPPPPERVAELTAKVATLDARIAALDAEKVQQ